MSFNAPHVNFSRMWFGVFVVAAIGCIAVTVAAAIGEQAVRGLVLSTLIGIFIVAGGMFGLLMTFHIARTHLPDADGKDHLLERSLQPDNHSAEKPSDRDRGFLGMFSLTQDASSGSQDQKAPASKFRRTA